jgi:hypothetical protein
MENTIDVNILIERYERHRQAVSRGIQAKFARDPQARAKWGGARRSAESHEKMQAGRIAKADKIALERGKLAFDLRQQGKTLRWIASEYEKRGIKTPRGKNTWNANQIQCLIVRYERLSSQS